MNKKWPTLVVATFSLVIGLTALAESKAGKAFLAHVLTPKSTVQKPLARTQTEDQPVSPDKPPVHLKNPPSGPVSEPLPWTAKNKLEALKRKYNTPIMVAAYRASLPEPILAERYNIGLAANLLAGTVVYPGEVFSQNRCIGPYTAERGFKEGPMYAGSHIITSVGGGVCKIASLLYNVVILANLTVVERHPHSMTVPYVPPGQDATVAYGVYDFRFRNTGDGPILIWAEMIGDTLYMAFYGQKRPPPVKWHHETLRRVKFWTEYRYNYSLPPGAEKVILPGQEGVVVHTWLTVEVAKDKVIRRDLGVDQYEPCPRVIERGPPKKAARTRE